MSDHRNLLMRWQLAAGLACLAASCVDPSPPRTRAARDAVIYGEDSRLDVYAVDDPAIAQMTVASTVAFMSAEHLVPIGGGAIAIAADTLAASNNLCPDQAFASQPAAAACSGVLIDDQLVLTAGHCVSEDATCDDQQLVFGYAITARTGAIAIADDAIYRCKSVPLRRHGVDADGRRWDVGFIELDRPVGAERRPVAIAGEAPPLGSGVVVIGYPSGLPAKVDAGAGLLSARPCMDYFTIDSDTFQSSSGSGVFDEHGRLVGIFARGGSDYAFDAERGCAVARRVEVADPADAEQASYVGPAIAALCATGWPSSRLCAAGAPVSDTSTSCAADAPTGCAAGGSRLAVIGLLAALVAIARPRRRGRRRSPEETTWAR
ncbi:MAG TPA: serine protease [Kofleriaceae bacterium]|nr:serine protease [Kofleriaceae bacterium]